MTNEESQLVYDTLGFKFIECTDDNIPHWIYSMGIEHPDEGYYLYPDGSYKQFRPDLSRYDTFIGYAGPYLKKLGFGYSCGQEEDGFFCCIFSFTFASVGNSDITPEEVYDSRKNEWLYESWQEALLKFIKSRK